jgi:hypothetical protein
MRIDATSKRYVIVCLACVVTGCSTLENVQAPLTASGEQWLGPTNCRPFGGVQRAVIGGTGLLGFTFPTGTPLALPYVAVDVPCSIVGDVVTLPIVIGRRQHWAWAEKWAQPAKSDLPYDLLPASDTTSPTKREDEEGHSIIPDGRTKTGAEGPIVQRESTRVIAPLQGPNAPALVPPGGTAQPLPPE